MAESKQDVTSQNINCESESGSWVTAKDLTGESSEGNLVVNNIDSDLDIVSTEFVGLWTQLVSTTNWEKGKIIHRWRQALIRSGQSANNYSDEAWSRQVGGVTAQHVGRLRRVHERFGEAHQLFSGLYWSHFFAALDWDDAEMWLEGAVQSRWSVSQMRRTRWEALGGQPDQEPKDADLKTSVEDEDFVPLSEADASVAVDDVPRDTFDSGPRYDDPDFGDADTFSAGEAATLDDDLAPWEEAAAGELPLENPFAKLPSLPTDLEEALELFKLAIVRHRASQWSEVQQESVLRALDALRLFAAQ